MYADNNTPILHRACVVVPGTAMYGNGSVVSTPLTLATDLVAILTGTLGRFEAQCTVVLDGVPLAAVAAQGDAARAAGWQHTTITPATLFHRPDGRVVTVIVRDALRGNQVGALFGPGTEPGVVAMLLDRYHALTGTAWRGTYVTTALAGIRLTWGNDRYQPLWHEPRIGPGYSAGPLIWSRELTADEQSWGWVHTFDTRAAYLGSAISADVAWSALKQTGPQMFDPKIPGYWLVQLEEATLDTLADPMRPPIVSPRLMTKHGAVWVTTPYARLLQDLGDRCEVLDSVTGQAGMRADGTRLHPAQSRVFRTWGERLRDALAAAEKLPRGGMRDALVDAVKRTYKDSTGGMQREGMRVSRPVWAHTVIDLRRATLYRRILRVRESQGVWPVAVSTDSVSYADCAPVPESRSAQGIETLAEAVGVRAGVGGLKYNPAQDTVTTAEWMAAHAPRNRKARR